MVISALRSIKSKYDKGLSKLHKYLDKELEYLDSQLYYTEQKKSVHLPMEYSVYPFSDEIFSIGSLPEPAIEEVIRINKKITDHTWGVILESEKVQNLNVYIAQMNKVQINARQANFFVVTDSEDILLKLHNVFNWMNKVFYITPNTYNTSIADEYRASINFHCLKHLEKHISTPQSRYMKLLKEMGGRQVTVPNPNRVFCFNSKRLVPGQ